MSYADEAVWHPQLDVTGIIGEYEDDSLRSNGSGKSTLVMSIIYALYGEGRFGTIDEVVYDKANPVDMFVEIEFLLNNNKYSILRGRKKSSPYLVVTENGQILGNEQTTIAQKQELINSVMGMDYDMFTATVFFEQGNAAKFINSGSSKSTEYLDKCLNLTAFRELIKTTNSEINKKRDALNETTSLSAEVQSSIDRLEIEIKSLDTSHIDISALEEDITRLQKDKSRIEEDLLKYQTSDKTRKELTSKKSELQAVLIRRDSVNKSIVDTTNDILAEKMTLHTETLDLDKVRGAIPNDNNTKLVEELEVYNSSINSTMSLVSEVQEELKDIIESINSEDKSRIKLLSDIDSLRRTMSKVSEGKCSHCLQDISTEYVASHQASISSEIDKITSALSEIDNRISVLNKSRVELSEKEQKLVSDMKMDSQKFSDLEKVISENEKKTLEVALQIKTLESSVASHSALIDKHTESIALLNTQLSDIGTIINTLTDDITKLESELAKLSDSDRDSLVKELYDISGVIDYKTGIIRDTLVKQGQVKSKTEELNTIISKKASLTVTLDTLKTEIKVFTIMVDIYKSMIESVFNDSVRLIEYYANLFLQKVYPNYSVRVYRDTKSKREPLIYEFICDGSKRNYSMLSGGQKTVADISLRLGFSKTLSDRAQTKIDFVCLDEPFESLDEPNREVIKSILVSLRDTFKQIFIISHTPDARDCTHTVKVFMNKNSQSSLKTA